jgi:hypothetical protein
MFCADLFSLLWQWKHSGDKIILLGDFNENVYTGVIATALSLHELVSLFLIRITRALIQLIEDLVQLALTELQLPFFPAG